MAVRMAFPSFIARSAQTLALGGAVAAAAIWLAAEVVERTQLGPDLATSRARLQAEVSGQFAALGSRLDAAVTAVTLDADTVRLAEQGDAAATRRLFDQAAAGVEASRAKVMPPSPAAAPAAPAGRCRWCASRRSPR